MLRLECEANAHFPSSRRRLQPWPFRQYEFLCSTPSLGNLVRGGTSLGFNLPMDKLPSVLDECTSLFAYDATRKTDRILTMIHDDLLTAQLEKALDDDLATGKAKARIAKSTSSQHKNKTIVAEPYGS